MLLSTQTEYCSKVMSDEETIRLLAKTGFDALDYSLFSMGSPDHPLHQDGWREYAHHLREVADECGIVFNQAHAPMEFAHWDAPFVSWTDRDTYVNCIIPS